MTETLKEKFWHDSFDLKWDGFRQAVIDFIRTQALSAQRQTPSLDRSGAVTFELDKAGAASNIDIEESTGTESFDSLVAQAITALGKSSVQVPHCAPKVMKLRLSIGRKGDFDIVETRWMEQRLTFVIKHLNQPMFGASGTRNDKKLTNQILRQLLIQAHGTPVVGVKVDGGTMSPPTILVSSGVEMLDGAIIERLTLVARKPIETRYVLEPDALPNPLHIAYTPLEQGVIVHTAVPGVEPINSLEFKYSWQPQA